MMCAKSVAEEIEYINGCRRNSTSVSPLSCVSCVPASCVHIWFVSCPCFMSLWVNSCPGVFMWLCVNYPVYISPVFLSLISSGLLVTPRCFCESALPCLALMSSLKIIILSLILVCVSLFLPRVCTVTTRANANAMTYELKGHRVKEVAWLSTGNSRSWAQNGNKTLTVTSSVQTHLHGHV